MNRGWQPGQRVKLVRLDVLDQGTGLKLGDTGTIAELEAEGGSATLGCYRVIFDEGPHIVPRSGQSMYGSQLEAI